MRWTLAALAAVAIIQIGGCVYDSDDGDLRVTVTNNSGQDLWLEVDDPVWGWRYVTEIDSGETLNVYFDEDVKGEKLRAQDDDDDTVAETTVQDGGTFVIGGQS